MKLIPKYFNENHIKLRVEWINNPSINNNMFFELPASVEKTKEWYERNKGNRSRVDFTFLNSDNLIVAMGGFTKINKTHKNAEFYIMVRPGSQGQGIGGSSSKWLYNYAFSVLNLEKIYLYTNDNNVAAYKIYEDAGFKLEGTLRKDHWKNSSFIDRRFYGLLREEWEHFAWRKYLNEKELERLK